MLSQPHAHGPQRFAVAIEHVITVQQGRNRSPQTIRAYRSDLYQLAGWALQDNPFLIMAADVTTDDVNAFLAHLARRNVSGVSRARKLAAIREFYRWMVVTNQIASSPVDGVDTPKRERKTRTYLTPEEYNRLLAAAGANPRDFCILTLFIQTGIRISELCALRIDDLDLDNAVLTVRQGKGMAARTIELEKKGIHATRTWLALRPPTPYPHLFLNRDEEPLKEWGVRDLVNKYYEQAGITRRVPPTPCVTPSPPTRPNLASLPSSSRSGWVMRGWILPRSLSTWPNRMPAR
ncbi:MAG: tyrosine-type recombinase/integrase [Thermomicrobiales bacterium]